MRYAWTGSDWAAVEGRRWPALEARFSVVSWNLWFDAHLREQRCQAIGQELAALRPQLIGFQEATLAMLRPFLAMDWLQREYWCSASPHSPPDSHGVILWGRVEPEALERQLLPGAMGRRALLCQLGGLTLGVVHLESQSRNAPVREAQLQQLLPRLQPARASILMGDFNFCASSSEGPALSDMQDAWRAANPEEPGWTLDPTRNPLLRGGTPARYDRIMVRGLQVESARLLGTEQLTSDHFGLAVELAATW